MQRISTFQDLEMESSRVETVILSITRLSIDVIMFTCVLKKTGLVVILLDTLLFVLARNIEITTIY